MSFALDYFFFASLSACGVLQIAASYSLLKGIYLLPNRLITSLLGLVLTLGAFIWFFASEPRNVPDTGPGLDGNQQATLFVAASMAAVLFTLVISSVVNWRMRPKDGRYLPGLSALRHASFLHALPATIRSLRAR